VTIIITQRLRDLYESANRTYGHLVDKFKQDIPKNLALAHICDVNPGLLYVPLTQAAHRGFMSTSIAAARRSNVPWGKLPDPLSCAYVWFTDANLTSYTLFTTYSTLFTTPNEDFWKCAYLNVVLEDSAFNALWTLTSPNALPTGVYPQLQAKVKTLRGSLPGWPVLKLQKQVLERMETLFALAKQYGPIVSTSPGRPPYLKGDDASRIFVE
jgi:hypothetical protein